MATLAFLLAAFLDPVQAALVLAIVLSYRGPLPIPVAAAVAAVASETIMSLAAVDYMWGELIAPRLVSSLLQAVVLCWIVGVVRTRWIGVAGSGAGRLPGKAAATLRSLSAGASDRRLAPWQMRAYVRRRLFGLRSK